MADEAATENPGLEAEEARLARAAAEGDGDAFATLYERYARRAYNLALRLGGSEEDAADAVQEAFVNVLRRLPELDERELVFRSYLFTATRNAALDLLRRQQRARPSDSIPEGAVPVGAGAGGMGLDPGDPDEDPDRRVLLASQREEIKEANARLPERQREALALRELEELSYDEIAVVMEMNRNSVAQLISRARINLRDELRGGALASVAASSPDCERALPLIATRDDGQLDPDSADAGWLDVHLAGCETCPVAAEAMQEAGASYRLWLPVAVAPWLFRETMARAAEAVGADWSEVRAPDPNGAAVPGLPTVYRAAAGNRAATWNRRTRRALTAALGVLLIGAATTLFAAQLDDATRTQPVGEQRPAVAAPVKAPVSKRIPKGKPASRKRPAQPADSETPPVPVSAPAPETVSPPPPDPGGGKEPPPAPPTTPSGGNVAPTESLEDEPSRSEPPAPPPPSVPPAEPPPTAPPPAEPPPTAPESPTPSAPPGSGGPFTP